MPHLIHDSPELDALYPSIVAPEDDMLDDPCEEDGDATYQQGLRVAHEIREMMQTQGRVRRVKPHQAPEMPRRKRDPSEMAATSSVCHRRSVKTYHVLAPHPAHLGSPVDHRVSREVEPFDPNIFKRFVFR